MRSKPGVEAFGAGSTATQVQGGAWPVQGAGWLELSERKRYTEKMKWARQLGQGLLEVKQGLELYSE